MQPIERVSQTDRVVKELTKFFLTEAINVGDKLPTEMELCERLRVGRSTVREAVRALQVMGYVNIEPGRGAFLKQKSLETPVHRILSWLGSRKAEVADIIEVRMHLEPFSVKLAVERGTESDVEKIDAIRREYEALLDSGPFSETIGNRLGELDSEFHAAICDASHNPLLIDLNSLVTEAFKEFRAQSFSVESHARNAIQPHRRIIAAILKRHASEAQGAMRKHLFKTLEDISLGAGE